MVVAYHLVCRLLAGDGMWSSVAYFMFLRTEYRT